MPLYAYRCTVCGHSFEKIQSFNSEPELACPKCGGALERPLTAPRFQFKGAGWYVNDYASTGSTSTESSAGEKKEKPAESTPAEAKKPAASESSTSTPSTPSTSKSSSTTPS